MSRPVVQMICAALTLLRCSQSSCCTFLGNFEVPLTRLIFLSVKWLPRMWVPLLLHSSLSRMFVPSCFLISLSLFFLLFCPVMSRVFALFGGSSSSASIQFMFCVSHFTCRCVFLMCLWEKMSTTSHSSTFLLPSPPS